MNVNRYIIAIIVTLHKHNWCQTTNLNYPQPFLPFSYLATDWQEKREAKAAHGISPVEHISCLHKDIPERIYQMHQNSSRATWYRSRSGRLMHGIDDRDGLDSKAVDANVE